MICASVVGEPIHPCVKTDPTSNLSQRNSCLVTRETIGNQFKQNHCRHGRATVVAALRLLSVRDRAALPSASFSVF